MTTIVKKTAQIRVYWHERQRLVRAVPAGAELVIGSGPKADVQVPDSAVSRLHCVIGADTDGRCTVRDLNSRNGTWVNGQRIGDQTSLETGDLVQVGYVTVVFLATSGDSGVDR